MSEEKKCINNEELCEGKQKLSIEELNKVNGGIIDTYQKITGEKLDLTIND